MRQINFVYDDIPEALDGLKDIEAELTNVAPTNVLLHVYLSGISVDRATIFLESINQCFGNIPRIGISEFQAYQDKTKSQIKFNLIIAKTVNFYSFQIDCESGNERQTAEDFIKSIQYIEDIKGIEICSANLLTDTTSFIEVFSEKYKEIPIFGSLSKPARIIGNTIQKRDDAFSIGEKISPDGYTIAIYSGDKLELTLNYIQSWHPIGKKMSIRLKSQSLIGSSEVYEIEGKPALKVFSEYLGIGGGETFLHNAWYFPLIVKRNNINICFTPSAINEESIFYSGRMYEHEKYQFSYCTSEEIRDASHEECKKIKKFSPEALMLIICCNRYAFLGEEEKQDLEYFKDCNQQLTYCHSCGEIACINNKGGVLNSALVAVSMRETNKVKQLDDKFYSSPKIRNINRKTIPLSFIISHFFRKMTGDIIDSQNALEREIKKITEKNNKFSLHIVQTLTDAIDAKDRYTNGHSGRVAVYSREIARRYGYSEEPLKEIYIIALLHDVGKIGIPDFVLNKTSKLTSDEYAVIKQHSVIGAHILNNIKEMPKLITGARWHHERYDGCGYPDGLSGTDIPEIARIIAVADAYDAMTSNRSYRPALLQNVVRQEIEKGKGKQFDPVFADIMLEMIANDTDYKMRDFSKLPEDVEENLVLTTPAVAKDKAKNNSPVTTPECAEETRHLSLQTLIDFGHSMPGGFFVYKAEGDEALLYANDIVLDIFGCGDMDEFKALTGFTFPGMVYEKDLERVEKSILQQVSEHSKKLDYVEYRIVRKDGDIRWVDDYGRLVNTVEYGNVYYVLIRDITLLRNTREMLSDTDSLTLLFNRRHFDREITKNISELMQIGDSLCLINIDIDKFRDYNYTCGHMAGDKCLVSIANIIKTRLRHKDDMVFRFAGNEFAILLPSTHIDEATDVADTIRLAVHDIGIEREAGNGIVTISAGVAMLTSEEARCMPTPSSELVRLAGMALKEAKEAGRNTVKSRTMSMCILK